MLRSKLTRVQFTLIWNFTHELRISSHSIITIKLDRNGSKSLEKLKRNQESRNSPSWIEFFLSWSVFRETHAHSLLVIADNIVSFPGGARCRRERRCYGGSSFWIRVVLKSKGNTTKSRAVAYSVVLASMVITAAGRKTTSRAGCRQGGVRINGNYSCGKKS